ncbi:hypothetical protein A2886_00160 [candidate division WWE3 bacterium RIFCSPHIGHO2_01_FULL_42_13]|uniref:HD domain-containing protein n=1 Tax=candidate division WWE3 bacterium RIFCSPHIGHO2_01_FULL_42_13 TaxID=1802617 RepID=A0A1F4UR21_UNCKA|nr:MAG: hypothetical protein A2886_00160 [candidate division WWE3 bacterium RIFCSPHIGHO2_01_FULL_42_13]
MQSLDNIKQEILDTLKNSPLDFEATHAQLVHKWVLILKPDADESLQIAALSHDIDRAITGITEKDLKDYTKIDEFKQEHAKRSAKFISEILEKHKYPKTVIQKVKLLVEGHEVGGNEEINILRDADSVAYFEYNIPSYMKRNGYERTKEKIRWMFVRMSPEAKVMIKDLDYSDPEIKSIIDEL